MEHVFRSLENKWIPAMGYLSDTEALKYISEYQMSYYNLQRPDWYNGRSAPLGAEEKINFLFGIS